MRSIIAVCFFTGIWAVGFPAGMGWAAPERPAKTWKTCEEMNPQELTEEQIDCRWSSEVVRNSQVPYAPAEDFPFQPPYTGEEFMYLSDYISPSMKWPIRILVNGKTINTRGSLYENQGITSTRFMTDESTYWERVIKFKGGEPLQYLFVKYNLPPSNYGFGFVEIDYKLVAGENSKPADRWLYLPSLRKVRRVPAPRREDVVPQYDFTFDDVLGRNPWEFDHRVMGTDIIYPEDFFHIPPHNERFPLPDWSGQHVEVRLENLPVIGGVKLPGYGQYDYPARPDGGVECYVIESKPKPDLLPGYYVGRLITWIDKKHYATLRVEEYDPKEDKLFFIYEFRYTNWFPEKGRAGFAHYYSHYWDIRIDHLSFVWRPHYLLVPPDRNWKEYLNPQNLLKVDEFEIPLNRVDFTQKDPHFSPLRPQLWSERFPQQRGTRVMANITPEIQTRIEKQNAAGRLVFDGEY